MDRPHYPRFKARGSQFNWGSPTFLGGQKGKSSTFETSTHKYGYTANLTPQNMDPDNPADFTVTVRKDMSPKNEGDTQRMWLRDKGGGKMNMNKEYPTEARAKHAAEIMVRSEENKWNKPKVRHARPEARPKKIGG